ncbi:MAG: DUF2283 domain-containing protein [Anaerolineales bacterium]|nr:DUF2283 domain-containing protein [Anaerolineales bacterium]MCB8953408.1 DUF2283 domain-containing protein [Ardenticatenales bacterium]
MKIRYFAETDTLYIELSSKNVAESIDLNANTIIDLDGDGSVVAITLEHAQQQANILEFTIEPIAVGQPPEMVYQPS